MNRPTKSLLFLAPVLAATVWTTWIGSNVAPGDTTHADATSPPAFQAQGVASCAAAACHHFDGPKGSKGSEYGTWAAHDPHARAYEVLFDEQSRQIVKKLYGLAEPTAAHPEREPLCRSCHVYPDPHLKGGPTNPQFAVADGVGCEACHGPAERWLARHYSKEWATLTPNQKAALGFVDTKDLRRRAEACAGCHVGRLEMDVNHDLIAAGHPRLRFEYGAYLANYTFRHWSLGDEKRRHADHEARAWAVGQWTAGKAALELLAYRAANHESKPWPEFAEYNCAACHHRLDGRTAIASKDRPGDMLWGTWYYALVPTLGGRGLDPLSAQMRRRSPNTRDVTVKALELAREFGYQAKAVNEAACDRAKLRTRFLALASARLDERGTASDWEGEAQRYLGLAALLNASRDLGVPENADLAAAVKEFGLELQKAFPKGKESVYDTPSRYSATEVRRQVERVRELLK